MNNHIISIIISTGGSTLSASANGNPLVENAPPLRFHRVCGENIVLESEGFRARRVESFCKGVLFRSDSSNVPETVLQGVSSDRGLV